MNILWLKVLCPCKNNDQMKKWFPHKLLLVLKTKKW